jgi:hypothetical protein
MKTSLLSKTLVGVICALIITLAAGAPLVHAAGLVDLTETSKQRLASQDRSGNDRDYYFAAGTVAGEATATPTQTSTTSPSVGTGDGSTRGDGGLGLALIGVGLVGGVGAVGFVLYRVSRSTS